VGAKRKNGATGRTPAHQDAQGRTHLVIHSDARGSRRLALSGPLFNEQWQDDVAIAAASTAHAFLTEGHTLTKAVELGRNAMAGTSRIAEGALGLSPEQPPACRPGCAHCCYQAVGVSAPEVFAIYDHLRASRKPDELDAAVRRIRDADDRTRGMTAAERLSPRLPCPFLEQERCSIYQVRPLACRGANSLDATACERTLRDPDARAEFLAGTLSVPCFLEPIRAFHAVTAGMQLALDELHGLQVLPLELTAAMRIMVDQPETAPQLWLAGQDPFNAARGGDVTNDPRIGEMAGRRA
jgi:putative zinc- or iron-chelating protein